MFNTQLSDQRLDEIRQALMHTDWRRFDRDDVSMLVNEIDGLRAALQSRSGAKDRETTKS